MANPIIDLKGQRFGRLTIIERAANDKHMKARWFCQCDCGKTTTVARSELRKGTTKSCGCYRVETSGQRLLAQLSANGNPKATHRSSRTREYIAWTSMKWRCFNPKCSAFKHYGGRGITVCEQWVDNFECFLKDVGPSPGKGFSLDRINNEGNYEPGNTKWSTQKEQMGHTRRSVALKH